LRSRRKAAFFNLLHRRCGDVRSFQRASSSHCHFKAPEIQGDAEGVDDIESTLLKSQKAFN
jgi:hypothetical protein